MECKSLGYSTNKYNDINTEANDCPVADTICYKSKIYLYLFSENIIIFSEIEFVSHHIKHHPIDKN